MARNHWGFKEFDYGTSDDPVLYNLGSHNPVLSLMPRLYLTNGNDPLTIPPAEDRTSALAEMRHFYDTVIAPDTSAVTFPDTWTDPRVLAWCLHNRYKYRIKLARRGYLRKVDPRALWLELPDLFYEIWRIVH